MGSEPIVAENDRRSSAADSLIVLGCLGVFLSIVATGYILYQVWFWDSWWVEGPRPDPHQVHLSIVIDFLKAFFSYIAPLLVLFILMIRFGFRKRRPQPG